MKLFYIKERHNPQTGVYFVACGQMTKKDAKAAEESLHGYNIVRPFKTKEAYDTEIQVLHEKGERVL